MSAQNIETFLARLYVDSQARSRFLADPRREARLAGFAEADCAALENIDTVGLELAAQSFAHKRASQAPRVGRANNLLVRFAKLATAFLLSYRRNDGERLARRFKIPGSIDADPGSQAR